MPKKSNKIWVNTVLLILGGGFVTFTVLRAHHVAMTHDEAYTYLHYVVKSVGDIMLYKAPHIPNNHILNTLLAKLSIWLFGLSDFNLRLPNVLFTVLYLWYAALLAKKLQSPWSQILGFLVLTTHVFFFDFFAMARGYGMGLALQMATIFHFYMYRKLSNGKHIYRTLIFAALAVYANFTFMYPYLALLVVINVAAFADGVRKPRQWWLINRPVLVVTGVLVAFITRPLMKISNNLFGGDAGFWGDTVKTLVWDMLYAHNVSWIEPLATSIGVILIAGAVVLLADAFIWPSLRKYFYQDIFIWLLITALGQICQHYLLGTQYLQGRTAIVYMPMFLVFLVFLLERLHENRQQVMLKNAALALISVLLLWNFFENANLKYAVEWQYDQHSDEVLTDMENALGQKPETAITLGASWIYEPSINFYIADKEPAWLQPVVREDVNGSHAFYLLHPEIDHTVHQKAIEENWVLVKEYHTGMKLYKNPAYL